MASRNFQEPLGTGRDASASSSAALALLERALALLGEPEGPPAIVIDAQAAMQLQRLALEAAALAQAAAEDR